MAAFFRYFCLLANVIGEGRFGFVGGGRAVSCSAAVDGASRGDGEAGRLRCECHLEERREAQRSLWLRHKGGSAVSGVDRVETSGRRLPFCEIFVTRSRFDGGMGLIWRR